MKYMSVILCNLWVISIDMHRYQDLGLTSWCFFSDSTMGFIAIFFTSISEMMFVFSKHPKQIQEDRLQ